jgi:histidinol-phosphate/aromatic aminotransferase/cobyric acid decarboxylase-like protein
MPLAVTSYKDLPTLADDHGLLNLAWTLDERDCLAVDLPALVASELTAEVHSEEPYVDRYFVQDPYGETELRGAVATLFETDPASLCVTCGAGVISLLHALAPLANRRPAYFIGDIYPDFPVWVEGLGGQCVSRLSTSGSAEHAANIRAAGASVVLLERPSLIGDELSDLQQLRELCEAVASRGTVVIADESYANYYPPTFSAVSLLTELDNLIVLRGLSKAYWLGGLRLAYCVTSNGLRTLVRSVVPPLLASSLSLRIGRRVLELGDITSPLRARIRANKAEMTGLLAAAGVTGILSSSEFLPYLFLKEVEGKSRSSLERKGILGKSHLIWSESTLAAQYLYRLSAPLTADRMAKLREKLGGLTSAA